MRGGVTALLAGAALATPAMGSERTGYQAIAAGDFASAAKTIEAERRIFPERPELMLNLAVAYARTGRAAAARSLYREVLDRPEVAMDMPDGTVVSSHAVATRGLTRLAPAVATR